MTGKGAIAGGTEMRRERVPDAAEIGADEGVYRLEISVEARQAVPF
jgi:hypothetical protein